MDTFSTEILINIFEFLDSPALQNVMEVSDRWYDIATMTSSIKQQLNLNINANNCEAMVKKSLNYPYRNIKITSNTSDGLPFLDFVAFKGGLAELVEYEFVKNVETIFLDHSRHLKVLELTNMNNIFAANVLCRCRNLVELRLDSVNVNQFRNNFYSQDVRTPETITLTNLLYLEVKDSSDLFSRIEAPHIETLIMHDDPGYEVLRHFLVITWDLKNLVLHDFNLRAVRRPQTFKFKLDKLTFKLKNNMNLFRSMINNRMAFEIIMQQIRNNYRENLEQLRDPVDRNRIYMQHVEQFREEIQRNQQEFLGNSLLNFLFQHQGTLKELNMNFDGLNLQASRILDSLLIEFNLTKLSLKSNYQSFNLSLPNASSSIKDLEIIGYWNFKDIQELIAKFPAVTDLKINVETKNNSDVISVIQSSMPNLKALEISTFFAGFSKGTNLEKLEKLKILQVNSRLGQKVWYRIAQTCSNVTRLTLIDDNFDVASQDLYRVLRKLTKLENLQFIGKTSISNLREVCSLFLDQNCNVKTVKMFGNVNRDGFYEEIDAVTQGTKTQITVVKV
ncbi:hypothetical protein ACKWTF_015906 [Chironomus riparius]